MKKLIAWPIAWILYLLGDLACIVMFLNDDSERWVNIWYPIYNRLMIASGEVQDWAYGTSSWWPWGPPGVSSDA